MPDSVTALRICTLGTATRDTIVHMKPRSLERMLLHNAQQNWLLLESGRKVEADFIQADAGGAAINSAVNFARQGFLTRIIAKVGTDLEANFVKKHIESNGINTESLVQTSDLPTARSVVIVAGDRNPTVLVDRGANGTLTTDEVSPEDIIRNDALYIGNLSNKSASVAPWAAKIAHNHDQQVFFNPGIRQITRYPKALKRSFRHITYLALNRVEAICLAPALVESGKSHSMAPGLVTSWLKKRSFPIYARQCTYWEISAAILKLGVAMVIITDSLNGAFAMGSDGIAWVCPALRTDVTSTLGAGDAYNSTFMAGIMNNQPVNKALQHASIQAASVVGHLNTQDGLLAKSALHDAWVKGKHLLPVLEQKLPV